MKENYVSPQLNLICFAPLEQLSTGELDLDVELLNMGTTLKASRAAGDPTISKEEDIFLPIG